MAIKITLEIINADDAKINSTGYKEGFRQLVQSEGREIYKYFQQPVSVFRNHYIIISQQGPVKIRNGDMDIVVGVIENIADNKIFTYVNWGTGPRIIRVRFAKLLTFMRNYSPATRPGSLKGGYYTRSLPWARRTEVQHSARARRFDKVIQHAMQGSIQYASRKKLSKLAKKTWI